MTSYISGFVLRGRNKDVTADFYAKLGLNAKGHEHGGPFHYEITKTSADFVVEVYQATETFAADALMLEVESIAAALDTAKEFGIQPKTSLKEVSNMKFIYISDPDGRDVMLIEKINQIKG